MEPDSSTPLLTPHESLNQRPLGDDDSASDSSDPNDNPIKRASYQFRLPFHYPHVHRSSRVRREAGPDGIATYHRYKYYSKLAGNSARAGIDTLSIPDHVVPPTFLFPFAPIIQPTQKQSSFITIFSIWNTMMGSSLLSIPWAIQEAGFAAGLVIMFVMGGICFYTAYRIVGLRSMTEFPRTAVEFPDLCRHLLGPMVEWVATFFSLIPLLGGAIVYWVLMSNFLYFIGMFTYESLIIGVNSTVAPNTSFPDVYCPSSVPVNESLYFVNSAGNSTTDKFYEYWSDETIPFYIASFFFPLVSFKSPTFFTKLNAFGTLSVAFLIIFVITKGAQWGIHFNTFDPTSINYVHLIQSTFPVLVGTLSLSFFIHNCVLSIMRNQKKPENNARDLAIAYVLVGSTYLVIGAVFFLTFPLEKSCIQDNLLNNFRSDDVLAVVTRGFLLFQVITLFPLIVYIMRAQIMHFAFGSVYPSWKPVTLHNVIVLVICVLFNIYLPKVGTIIRYCGAISGLAYIFTLPCITYMKVLKDKKRLNVPTIILHTFIIVLGVCNFISQFIVQAK